MRTILKTLIILIVLIFLLAFFGPFIYSNYIDRSSIDPSSSVVYIQNEISGVVMINDPTLNKTVTLNVNDPLDSGTGEIVSKNGYIITAFHVIGDPSSLQNGYELKKMDSNDINQYLEQVAVTEYVSKYNPQFGTLINLPTGVRSQNTNYLTNYLIQSNLISVNSSKQNIIVKTASSNSYLNAQIVDVGNPSNDEDIALLKVNANNLPALNISSNNALFGEPVRIYGYPGNGGNTIKLASSSGTVLTKVVNDEGIVYYETNAPTESGYSGGPTLDNQNRILGIIIYGVQTSGHFRSQTTSGDSLFLSSQYLIKICQKNNVPINIS